MKNYILHIGLCKTATTAIQREYFPYLSQSQICYNPPLIVRSLTEALKLLDFEMLKKADLRLLRDVITDQETKILQQNVLISHEILSQRLGKFDFRKRGVFLKSIFPNATILLVLRYQPDLLRSLYQQYLHQNYLLKPEEVFIPFAKHLFLDTEHWKANMLIDIKEWNYTAVFQHFKSLYGKQFHVLFYENFPQILDLGKAILTLADCQVDTEVRNSLPKVNIRYSSVTVNLIFILYYLKLAFRANRSIDSRHIQDLMDQANQARFTFDASSVEDFLNRMKNTRPVSRISYNWLDAQFLKFLKNFNKICIFFKCKAYKLPLFIEDELKREAMALNASLHEVINDQSIPERYFEKIVP